MAELIEAFMGLSEPRMTTDGFQAIMGEYVRGKFGTVGQAGSGTAALAEISALRRDQNNQTIPLNTAEQAEANALVQSIVSLSGQARANRALEIRDVLMLAELGTPSYNTPAKVRAKLGLT